MLVHCLITYGSDSVTLLVHLAKVEAEKIGESE